MPLADRTARSFVRSFSTLPGRPFCLSMRVGRWHAVRRATVIKSVSLHDLVFPDFLRPCDRVGSECDLVTRPEAICGAARVDAITVAGLISEERGVLSNYGWIGRSLIGSWVDTGTWRPSPAVRRNVRRAQRAGVQAVFANRRHYGDARTLIDRNPNVSSDSAAHRSAQVSFLGHANRCGHAHVVAAFADQVLVGSMAFIDRVFGWHLLCHGRDERRSSWYISDMLYSAAISLARCASVRWISWGATEVQDYGLLRMKGKFSTAQIETPTMHWFAQNTAVEVTRTARMSV